MTNDMRFYFKDLDALFGKKPAYILVTSKVKIENCNGREVATMTVQMGGYDQDNTQMFLVSGCPCPPCKPRTFIDSERQL